MVYGSLESGKILRTNFGALCDQTLELVFLIPQYRATFKTCLFLRIIIYGLLSQ